MEALRVHHLQNEFARRGPWVTCFNIDGANYGGSYPAEADHRLQAFLEVAGSPGDVLELGCLEGGHTFPLARVARSVTAIDSRDENLQRARWVQSLLGVSNIRFAQINLETDPLDSLGRFDWVFNVGLLYHLPEPWKLLERLSLLGRSMFLWTHVAKERKARITHSGYTGCFYDEHGVADPLSGMSGRSFWPTYPELRRMLADCGFEDLELLQQEEDHPHGAAVTLICRSQRFEQSRRPQDARNAYQCYSE